MPRPAAVERDLDADDLPAAAPVGVALHIIRLLHVFQLEHLAVARRRDRRVDVELVDDVVRLEPPALGLGLLRRDVDGQDAVVLEVVVVVGARVRDLDLLEPLDHPAADEARDDDAEREAVVRLEPLAVLLPAEDDVVRLVHDVAERQRRAVRPVGARGELLVRAAEGDVAAVVPRRGVRRDAVRREDVREVAAAPLGHAEARRAPVEADGALDHVLLLAAVARADEEHGPRDLGQRLEEREGEGRVLLDAVAREQLAAPLVEDLVRGLLVVFDGDLAVVPHVVERRGRAVAVRDQERQRRLHVKRVAAREADELRRALHPRVGRRRVFGVGDRILLRMPLHARHGNE
mmetsp:Transcript_28577/g.88427  ORF Transcript_28577/g.88427 Transcript_28577/m.88427 type:complete len:348 (+) Transcript_28577:1531-2574(+)